MSDRDHLLSLHLPWIADPKKIHYDKVPILQIPPKTAAFSLYHSALMLMFRPYRSGYLDKKRITDDQFVASLVSSMEKKLIHPVHDTSDETHYMTLNGGRLPSIAIYSERYSLEGVTELVKSESAGIYQPGDRLPMIENVVIEYLAKIIQCGIIVLDSFTKDVYPLECEEEMKKFDETIVLLFVRANEEGKKMELDASYFAGIQFQPMGDQEEYLDGELQELSSTIFSTQHPFIVHLYERLQEKNERREKMRQMR